MSPKIIFVVVAIAAAAAGAAAYFVPKLTATIGEGDAEQAAKSSAKAEPEVAPPKPVRVLMSAFQAPVVDVNGNSRPALFVMALLNTDDKWAEKLCELTPRLVEGAVGHFESHPLNADSRGTVALGPRPALMQAMNHAIRDETGADIITELALQLRSGAVTPKVQAKALKADYLCVDSKAGKP